jgi:hypothetical protein
MELHSKRATLQLGHFVRINQNDTRVDHLRRHGPWLWCCTRSNNENFWKGFGIRQFESKRGSFSLGALPFLPLLDLTKYHDVTSFRNFRAATTSFLKQVHSLIGAEFEAAASFNHALGANCLLPLFSLSHRPRHEMTQMHKLVLVALQLLFDL